MTKALFSIAVPLSDVHDIEDSLQLPGGSLNVSVVFSDGHASQDSHAAS
jgi:hypothetical protein